MLFYSQLSRVTWKRPRPKRDKNQDCYSRGHICLSMAFIHRFISLGELSIIDKRWIGYGTNLFTYTCYRTLSCMWDYVWWFMIKGSSPVTRNLWCQSAPGNQSGAVRHFPEAVRPRDRATGNELRLVSWHPDGSHVCSLSIFFKNLLRTRNIVMLILPRRLRCQGRMSAHTGVSSSQRVRLAKPYFSVKCHFSTDSTFRGEHWWPVSDCRISHVNNSGLCASHLVNLLPRWLLRHGTLIVLLKITNKNILITIDMLCYLKKAVINFSGMKKLSKHSLNIFSQINFSYGFRTDFGGGYLQTWSSVNKPEGQKVSCRGQKSIVPCYNPPHHMDICKKNGIFKILRLYLSFRLWRRLRIHIVICISNRSGSHCKLRSKQWQVQQNI